MVVCGLLILAAAAIVGYQCVTWLHYAGASRSARSSASPSFQQAEGDRRQHFCFGAPADCNGKKEPRNLARS
jgi:hypothetical protein